MKLPNGYGSVYKLSGKRRNPWVAAKTDGYEEQPDGSVKRIYHIIGYFSTRASALQALADFNENPYDIDLSKTTFAEIYQKWLADTFDEKSNPGTLRNYTSAYKKTTAIQQMKMSDIRPSHMQAVIDGIAGGYQAKYRVLALFNKMYRWCIQHECIKKNYAELVKINETYESKPRQRFTTEELNKVWSAKSNPNAELVIALLYTGVRVMELFDLKKEDVDLSAQCFVVRQSKTAAGIRTVPIADYLIPIFEKNMNRSHCEYAFCNQKGEKMSYDNFKRRYWMPFMEELGISHTIHETRHTFISMATAKNINPTLIKKIVGHKSIMSLTEKVYTHPEVAEMVEAVNLLVTC